MLGGELLSPPVHTTAEQDKIVRTMLKIRNLLWVGAAFILFVTILFLCKDDISVPIMGKRAMRLGMHNILISPASDMTYTENTDSMVALGLSESALFAVTELKNDSTYQTLFATAYDLDNLRTLQQISDTLGKITVNEYAVNQVRGDTLVIVEILLDEDGYEQFWCHRHFILYPYDLVVTVIVADPNDPLGAAERLFKTVDVQIRKL